MTNRMIETLQNLFAGNENSMSVKDWDRRTLNALESRGYIEIRGIDGFIRVTSTGENYVLSSN